MTEPSPQILLVSPEKFEKGPFGGSSKIKNASLAQRALIRAAWDVARKGSPRCDTILQITQIMYSYSLAQLFVNTLKSCVHKKRLEEQQESSTLHVTHLEAASTSAVGISLVEIQDQSPSAHVNHTDDSDHTVVELNSITPQHVTFYSTAGSKPEETTTIDFVGISSTGSFQSSLEDIVREAQAAVLPFRRRLSEVEFAFNVDKDTTNHQS
eukprot:PhF_6_TR15120/c0_g1_i2/m.23830